MDLVTVAVCTYNSSEYIIETLESIAKQTYMEIELIVSDDASNDNTIDLVEEWLNSEINKHRFIKSQLLKVKKNTGVPANANRALNASNGKWIKYIGADDVLLPSCITDNIYEVTKNTKIKVLFSKLDVFLNTFHESNYLYTTPNEIKQNSILWPQRNSQEQYKMLLISDRIHFTPSVFLHNDTLKKNGGFDERFKLLEDYPLWLKLTKAGVRLYFMNKKTVFYRKHSKAINNSVKEHIINPNYFSSESMRRIYTYPYLPLLLCICQRYNWIVSQIFRIEILNTNNRFNLFLYNLLLIYLNPGKYLIWFIKRLPVKKDSIYTYC